MQTFNTINPANKTEVKVYQPNTATQEFVIISTMPRFDGTPGTRTRIYKYNGVSLDIVAKPRSTNAGIDYCLKNNINYTIS